MPPGHGAPAYRGCRTLEIGARCGGATKAAWHAAMQLPGSCQYIEESGREAILKVPHQVPHCPGLSRTERIGLKKGERAGVVAS